jgi:Flp pilus assembly protein TadD
MNLGAALATQGRYSEALDQFNKALELEPTLLEPLFGRGMVYGSMGQWGKAEQEFRNGLAQDRSSVVGWKGLGVVMLRTGRYAQALEAFGYAQQLSPHDASIQANIDLALKLRAASPQTQPAAH